MFCSCYLKVRDFFESTSMRGPYMRFSYMVSHVRLTCLSMSSSRPRLDVSGEGSQEMSISSVVLLHSISWELVPMKLQAFHYVHYRRCHRYKTITSPRSPPPPPPPTSPPTPPTPRALPLSYSLPNKPEPPHSTLPPSPSSS